MVIGILILLYVVSFVSMWLYVHYIDKFASKNDFICTVFPIVNTIGALIGWFDYFIEKENIDYNKFFNIKK